MCRPEEIIIGQILFWVESFGGAKRFFPCLFRKANIF